MGKGYLRVENSDGNYLEQYVVRVSSHRHTEEWSNHVKGEEGVLSFYLQWYEVQGQKYGGQRMELVLPDDFSEKTRKVLEHMVEMNNESRRAWFMYGGLRNAILMGDGEFREKFPQGPREEILKKLTEEYDGMSREDVDSLMDRTGW